MQAVVVNGATLKCTFGLSPGIGLLKVTSQHHVAINGQAVATENDFTNISPFGLCSSPTNPQVIAAQGAPQPCAPMCTTKWMQGSSILRVNGAKALTKSSCTTCMQGGKISIQAVGFVQTD